MRGLVLYRSHYGNTKLVAEALAKELGAAGVEARIQDLRHRLPDLAPFDLILVGAPTRMANACGKARRLLKKLKKRGFTSGRVAVFDTYGPVPTDPAELEKGRKWLYPGAAGILQAIAADQGLDVHPATLRCEVAALKGPLAEKELDKVKPFVQDLVASLGKKA
jgi:flavodoxin